MKKYHIFTDADLDGSGSYLTFCWLVGLDNISYTVTTVNKLEKTLTNWVKTQSFDDYDNVYFFDLDTDNAAIASIIDRSNVYIFDHHKTNENSAQYKNAKLFIDPEAGSTCKLIYKLLSKGLETELSVPKKLLVSLVNDYDSYTLKSPLSKKLNTVFWNYQGDRLQKFVRDFKDGFTEFNKFHLNVIKRSQDEFNNLISGLEIFNGDVQTSKGAVKVSGAIATSHINDIADYVGDQTNCDAVFVVNTKSSKVSFRANKDNSVSAITLAESMTDECGGHEGAAGGILCDKFMGICKTLQPIVL